MTTQTTFPDQAAIADQIAQHRGWFTFLGILLIVSGALAVIFPLIGSLTVEVWAAIAFIIAGVSQTVHAFAAKQWSGFLWGLLTGLLYLASGLILWLYPINGIVTLTIFLAAVFLVDGVFRLMLAYQIRSHDGWYWVLLSGVLSILIAAMIFGHLPSSAAWALGLLFGINLIGAGASFLALTYSPDTLRLARRT